MKKPKHLFRPMTAKEVEEFWTDLYEAATMRESRIKGMLTDDKQGVRWMMYNDFNAVSHQKDAFEQARHMFIDILARKDT
jgi:hypothetical protein